MYHLGAGVIEDKVEAMKLYQLAIDQGNEYALFNLGSLYANQAQYDKAGKLLKQYLIIQEEALGRDHVDIAYALNNLAYVYESQGRYKDAEPLYKKYVF